MEEMRAKYYSDRVDEDGEDDEDDEPKPPLTVVGRNFEVRPSDELSQRVDKLLQQARSVIDRFRKQDPKCSIQGGRRTRRRNGCKRSLK